MLSVQILLFLMEVWKHCTIITTRIWAIAPFKCCALCGFLRVSSWRIACATTLIDRYASRKAAQVLHGGGTFSNSGNRWFDKTLQVGMRTWMARDGLFRAADAECWLVSVFEQFVVGEDGSWGLLYEQATAEGPPVATLLDHVIEYWWDVGMKLQMCWISQEKLSWGGEWWGVCSECLRFFFLSAVRNRTQRGRRCSRYQCPRSFTFT